MCTIVPNAQRPARDCERTAVIIFVSSYLKPTDSGGVFLAARAFRLDCGNGSKVAIDTSDVIAAGADASGRHKARQHGLSLSHLSNASRARFIRPVAKGKISTDMATALDGSEIHRGDVPLWRIKVFFCSSGKERNATLNSEFRASLSVMALFN